MHDKPQPSFDTPTAGRRPLEIVIAELESVDPAAAPDLADEIAVRLEAELMAASAGSAVVRPANEQLAMSEAASDDG